MFKAAVMPSKGNIINRTVSVYLWKMGTYLGV